MLFTTWEDLNEAVGHPMGPQDGMGLPIELSLNEIGQLRANPLLSIKDLTNPGAVVPPSVQFPFEDDHRLLPRPSGVGNPLFGYGESDRNPPMGPASGILGPNSTPRGAGGMVPSLNGRGGDPFGTKPRFDPPMGPFGGPF